MVKAILFTPYITLNILIDNFKNKSKSLFFVILLI